MAVGYNERVEKSISTGGGRVFGAAASASEVQCVGTTIFCTYAKNEWCVIHSRARRTINGKTETKLTHWHTHDNGRVPNNNVLNVLNAGRARVMSIKNDRVKKIQNEDQLKKKNRDVTANDDATTRRTTVTCARTTRYVRRTTSQ